jgi:hypothetical protein
MFLIYIFFYSRIQAKGYYLKTGIRKMMKKGGLKDFTRDIVLEVDGKRVELPSLEGIVIMNILRYEQRSTKRNILFLLFSVGQAVPIYGDMKKMINLVGRHIMMEC